MQRFSILIAAVLLSSNSFAADKIYISIDESGQLEASDRQPARTEKKDIIEVRSRSDTPDPVADAQQERSERIDRMNEEMAAERKQKQLERTAAEQQRKLQKQSCATSRNRLRELESQPPNRRLVINADGSAHRVTAEEMQRLLESARRQVIRHCGSLDEPADAAE
jgi:hypothetical protein